MDHRRNILILLIVLITSYPKNAVGQTIIRMFQTSSYNPYVYNIGPKSLDSLNNGSPNNNYIYSWGNVTNYSPQEQIKCGDVFSRSCEKSRYRSYDGSCNNLQHPTWGMANTRYDRLLNPRYSDGVNEPPKSVTGADLPLSRSVSYTLFPPLKIDDPIWTLAAMQWGQVITHDMALVDGTTQSIAHPTQCCTPTGEVMHPRLLDTQCYPIIVPYNDPVYSRANIRCLDFVRSTTDIDRGCSPRHKAAEQLTVVTHFLDLSLLYGSDTATAKSLRSGVRGRMLSDIRRNREWLPSVRGNKSSVCDTSFQHETCYNAGDTRANQNPGLVIMHTLLLREHNRVAGVLSKLNPHWTDETIFQETRRILIAEHQQISYYEWLPIFLGTKGTYGTKILYQTQGYVDDYDPHVDPSVLNEHSTAAYRYFHSLVAGYLNTVSEGRYFSPYNALRLSDHFNRPAIIEEGNNMDDLTRGMSYQAQRGSDQYFDEEITQFLFRNKKSLGNDLRSIDIQRNRDHGLASYNAAREACGLPRATYFSDFLDLISEENVEKLAQLYANPDDVDLTVGGSLEQHVEGTLSGPTFLCIMMKQFWKTRVGDRYWYERSNRDTAFTLEQLAEIRKASMARLFCDNGDHIQKMQPNAFQQVSIKNPLMDCSAIPAIDLSLWKDYAPDLAKFGNLAFKK